MEMKFYERVGLVCSRIPRGRVATYGQIALLCGKPENSRQVGYALKHGLAGENAPAHRVVNAAGILSGAAHFASMDLQCLLLREEGVEVLWTPKGWRTDLKRYGWKNTMEEALELNRTFSAMNI
jgi:methylated-DNA-protein-cysteine methyltransferase-like protein